MIVSEENFRKVCIQRECLAKALGLLIDNIRYGVYNHMLPDVNQNGMHTEVDAGAKCHNGHTRREVIWSMGRLCLKCDKYPCKDVHLNVHEYKMFESMDVASDILDRPNSEMPEIKPEDFIKYEPDKYTYEATPTWIARNIYKLVVGYLLYSDHSDKEIEKKWERAFDDTLAICLGVYGKEYSELINAKEIDSEVDGDEFKKSHPDVMKFLEIINERLESKPLYDVIRDKDACIHFKTVILLAHAVVLRLEYGFGNDYPGADMGVYGDEFNGIIDMCLSIAGLYENQDKCFGHDVAGIVAEAEYKTDKKSEIVAFMYMTEGLRVHEVQGSAE